MCIRDRLYCDPAHNRYRQHPLDYVESLEASVRQALAACGRDVADAVCGISFDTTASTPALTDAKGTARNRDVYKRQGDLRAMPPMARMLSMGTPSSSIRSSMARDPKTVASTSALSVSYTHLDVYKRQLYRLSNR